MKVKAVVKRLITIRKKNPPKRGEELFLDLVLEGTEDDERQFDDVVTYMVAGFHTTGNGLCWAMYFLAKHQDCQDKLAAELKDVLGDAKLDHTNLGELKYLQQVIDETLRYATLLPFTARVQDFDQELGGYMVPKNTPVIHALGVALADETAFPHPEKFDPERFTKDTARERSSLAFSPFGFAGKRSCPGKRFANVEIAVALAVLLQKVKVTLVEGQNIKQVNGFVTHPNEEIWITLSKR